jgi:hypothetical protein
MQHLVKVKNFADKRQQAYYGFKRIPQGHIIMEITRRWKSRREEFWVVLKMDLRVVCHDLAQGLIAELERPHPWPIEVNFLTALSRAYNN